MLLDGLWGGGPDPIASPTAWDPTTLSAAGALSESNLRITALSGYFGNVRSALGVSSGKYYWENTIMAVNNPFNYHMVGVVTAAANIAQTVRPGVDAYGWTFKQDYGDHARYHNNVTDTAYGASGAPVVGDVFAVLLDMDAGEIAIAKNGVSYGVMFTGLVGPVHAVASVSKNGDYAESIRTNFGGSAFTYPVPDGYRPGLGT